MDKAGLCIGCGACAVGAPIAATGTPIDWDGFGQLKPRGPWAEQPRAEFARICPFSPEAANEDEIARERFGISRREDSRLGRFETAYVGYAAEGRFREIGSSGGMVSWVAAELLSQGLIDGVAHVVPENPSDTGRFFAYRISRSVAELEEGAKSRYYPVELSSVLEEIRSRPGRYAVVGIPCFMKAVHLLRTHDPLLSSRIAYTLGLFCGHMKSARFVESFAWQLRAPIEEVRAVEYRRKDPDRPANWYTAHLTLADGSARWQDWWHLVDGDWGAGFFQNAACSYCDDIVSDTADVAFGDAWVEPHSSDGRGTNVVIVRDRQIGALVRQAMEEGRLALTEVDADFVAGTQAAGIRQRREGLAYRLAYAPPALPLRKRVPASRDIPPRRKLIYRMRRWISLHGHLVFAAARRWHLPSFYLRWARTAKSLYEAAVYLRGPLGKLVARLEAGANGDENL